MIERIPKNEKDVLHTSDARVERSDGESSETISSQPLPPDALEYVNGLNLRKVKNDVEIPASTLLALTDAGITYVRDPYKSEKYNIIGIRVGDALFEYSHREVVELLKEIARKQMRGEFSEKEPGPEQEASSPEPLDSNLSENRTAANDRKATDLTDVVEGAEARKGGTEPGVKAETEAEYTSISFDVREEPERPVGTARVTSGIPRREEVKEETISQSLFSALLNMYRGGVDIAEDGKSVTLQRENGEPFTVPISEARRLVEMGKELRTLNGENTLPSIMEGGIPTLVDVAKTETVDLELPSHDTVDIPLLPKKETGPAVDIELPLEAREANTRSGAIAEAPTREATRTVEVIQNDIAYLERARSGSIAYNSDEFSNFVRRHDPEFAERLEELGGSRDAAAIMWIERKVEEYRNEGRESLNASRGYYDERFDKEFGITREELDALPGYRELTHGQRVLLYENLKDYAEHGDTFMESVWTGIREKFGAKSEGIPRKGTRGIDAYKNELQMMMYATRGLRVHVEGGKAMPDFVGIEFDRKFRPEQKQVVDELNRVAHEFARIPSSWQEDGNGVHDRREWEVIKFLKNTVLRTKSRMQYKEYELHQRSYEKAKERFAEKMLATGASQEDVVRALITVDSNVHMSRFVDTNPEAIATLQKSLSTEEKESIGASLVTKAAYIGLGVVSKRAAAGAVGWLGGPVVASALAGIKSWNKSSAEQRERDRMAQRGENVEDRKYDTLKLHMQNAYRKDQNGSEYHEALKELTEYEKKRNSLNIVSARSEIKTSEGNKEAGLIAKLEEALREYEFYKDSDETVTRGGRGGAPEVVHKKRDLAARSLVASVIYAEDKLRLNRLRFGDKEHYALNKAAFIEAYTRASIVVAEQKLLENTGNLVTAKRLGSFLNRQEERISVNRGWEHAKKLVGSREVYMAGGLALIGASAQELGLVDATIERGGKVVKKAGEWLGGFSMPSAGASAVAEVVIPKETTLDIERQFGITSTEFNGMKVLRQEGVPFTDGGKPESMGLSSDPMPQAKEEVLVDGAWVGERPDEPILERVELAPDAPVVTVTTPDAREIPPVTTAEREEIMRLFAEQPAQPQSTEIGTSRGHLVPERGWYANLFPMGMGGKLEMVHPTLGKMHIDIFESGGQFRSRLPEVARFKVFVNNEEWKITGLQRGRLGETIVSLKDKTGAMHQFVRESGWSKPVHYRSGDLDLVVSGRK